MQEIKKRRIVIASVLKPVDEPRMFEKIGQSLAKYYEVHIIGFPGRIQHNSITQHPLPSLGRLGIARLIRPWQIFLLTRRLKPDVFIAATHELLWPGMLLKLTGLNTLVYDLQENYWRNILYTNAFPRAVRPFLAAYVRLKERMVYPFLDFCFTAERGYLVEMPFIQTKSLVLENKYKPPSNALAYVVHKTSERIRLLFTGTISETTGVFTAIRLAEQLHEIDKRITLTIAGFCAAKEELTQLRQQIFKKEFIKLIAGDAPLSHEEILKYIHQSDFGIVAYPPNPSTENCMPTKLFEYVANRLPILVIDHPPWVDFVKRYSGGVVFSSPTLDPRKLLSEMDSTVFYPGDVEDVFWDSEEEKLLEIFSDAKKNG